MDTIKDKTPLMRKYFFAILLTVYFLGLIPIASCNKNKCGVGEFEIVIDHIATNFYLENNIEYDSLSVFKYNDLGINLEISDYHIATRNIHSYPDLEFGNVAFACDPVVHNSKDRIRSMNIMSTDTIITDLKTFLPGEDISTLFSFDINKDSIEVNKSLVTNEYFLSPYEQLRIYYRVTPNNMTQAQYLLGLNFQSGKNLKTITQKIQLE